MDKRLHLVAITDRRIHGGLREMVEACAPLLEAGLSCLMLREKDLSGHALLEAARILRALTRRHGAFFIVNDRVDVALAAEADGVHLGHSSIPLRDARRIVPAGMVIGVSCHGRTDLLEAQEGGADYTLLSPVYTPISKEATSEPLGAAGFLAARQGIRLPVIALGGIKPDDVVAVASSGASGVATIGGIFAAEDRIAALRSFQQAIREMWGSA